MIKKYFLASLYIRKLKKNNHLFFGGLLHTEIKKEENGGRFC